MSETVKVECGGGEKEEQPATLGKRRTLQV
jgi:hypothetical protein